MNNIFVYENDIPDSLSLGNIVAVDTESMGLINSRDRLCLIQLSGGDGYAHLVQFSNSYNAPNLIKMLTDKDTLKIFHFARFDIAIIKYYLKVWTSPCYCTKIASKLVRTYTDNHGLKELCSELLGVKVNKSKQSSDWGQKVLSKEQLHYAASDVLYLHELKTKLDVMLKREDRNSIAQSCFDFLETRAELDLLGWDSYDIFAHNTGILS